MLRACGAAPFSNIAGASFFKPHLCLCSLVHVVDNFYNHESKHEWRKHLAARLLQLHLSQHELLNEVSEGFSARAQIFGSSLPPALSPNITPFFTLLTLPYVCACLLANSQLLTAMAEVQITVVQEMMQKLWIKQQPLLLLVGTWPSVASKAVHAPHFFFC